jgi:hypothetical protein
VDAIISAAELRPRIIEAIEHGLKHSRDTGPLSGRAALRPTTR